MADFSALDQLVDIITSGVTEIKRAYMNAGIAAPRLDEPWAPTPVDEEINTPALLVSSAATQLVALLRDPHQLLFEAVWGVSASVRYTSSAVTDYLFAQQDALSLSRDCCSPEVTHSRTHS
jgi:hypothetical protein